MKNLIFLIILLNFHASHQSKDEKRLHDYLFVNSSYNAAIRPIRNSSAAVHVDVKFILKRVFYIDEINHKVVLFSALSKKWKDDYLVWNASAFNGINYTYVDYSKIWTPQIELVSKYSNENNMANKPLKEIYDDFPVKVDCNGNVEFIPTVHLTTNCLFTYLNFPLDIQLCNLLFQSPYNTEQLQYHLEAIMSVDNNSSMWDAIDLQFINVMDPLGKSMDNVLVSLKRKVKSYLFTIPSYIVYTLTLIMFLLPQQSSQRIVIGSTCLVMFTLLTYMLSTMLPHSEISAWPLLGKLYLFNAVMLTFSLLFSSFIINLSQNHHNKSVPNWLKTLTIKVLSRVFCIQALVNSVFNSFDQKIYYEDEIAHIQTGLEDSNQQENANEAASRSNNEKIKELFKKVYEHIQQIRFNYQRYSYKHNINNEWLLIATIIDRILFLIYTGIILLSTFTILKTK